MVAHHCSSLAPELDIPRKIKRPISHVEREQKDLEERPSLASELVPKAFAVSSELVSRPNEKLHRPARVLFNFDKMTGNYRRYASKLVVEVKNRPSLIIRSVIVSTFFTLRCSTLATTHNRKRANKCAISFTVCLTTAAFRYSREK